MVQQQPAQTQTGILLLQNGVVPPRFELPVPRPPPPPALPDPIAYAHLLPTLPAGALRAWVAPATTKLQPQLVIIGDPRERMELQASGRLGGRELNGQAVFLTVDLQTGFGKQVGLRAGAWRPAAHPPAPACMPPPRRRAQLAGRPPSLCNQSDLRACARPVLRAGQAPHYGAL